MRPADLADLVIATLGVAILFLDLTGLAPWR